ncbi:peptidyl-prolyl cis-trans isomerase [Patiriisocius marinistellae]|uniref:Peptidyl-prolyl cis-trans isomerase n=1 Tax=Patiriisocius marinistellae TaxID=2494560 RepID=A0A5J4FZU0_9FLAO|nr:peptidylprolyl isomerase [Patiriisocius marinistellae]GEQ86724.1 peptidyl-prolyl cis-trans isomerase [Patiriisocius marinistellae]
MNKNVILLVFLATIFSAYAQKNKDVLMTIDGKPVYSQEFINVYKKNLDLVKDEKQKSVDGYLDLFIDYKLKVTEAYAQGLDKDKVYKREFEKYRDQLSRNYIYETQVTENLALEAYERSKEEINADHILIKVGYDASPQDTLTAYNKISEARARALSGEDFKKLVTEYSEEPGAAKRGGALGYFTAFSMVYPFENMAYKTKKGDISQIVRSSFGYHIISVNDRRPSSDPVIASHIMILIKDGNDIDAEKRINEIYQLLEQGGDFSSLAKEFSDDKNSGAKGGLLKMFKRGQLRSTEFEDVVYKLEVGEISKPVKTNFGWHVIRLEEHVPSKTYEEQKEDLLKRIERGDRSKVIESSVNKKIIDKYGVTLNDYMDDLKDHISDDIFRRKWELDTLKGAENKLLLNIGGDKKIYFNDFLNFIVNNQSSIILIDSKEQVINNLYKLFESKQLTEYFKMKLEEENPEYGAVVQEYRDGLLIFDVMQKNIWKKAANDTIGVRNFYNKVASKYQWQNRVKGTEFSGSNKEILEKARKLLTNGMISEKVKESLNSGQKVNVLITERVYESGDSNLPTDFKFEKGISEIFKVGDSYRILKINEILPATQKTFDEVKGKILNEYQGVIEKEWMNNLRKKYNVEVNKKQLKKVKKSIEK